MLPTKPPSLTKKEKTLSLLTNPVTYIHIEHICRHTSSIQELPTLQAQSSLKSVHAIAKALEMLGGIVQ